MKISDHRITIKTLRPSEHGWSPYSHQTHIGYCADYIDGWEKKLVLDGFAVIKDFGMKRMTAYSSPIIRESGDHEAPKFKTNPHDPKYPGKYTSILKVAKEASEAIYNEWETSNILTIICFNEQKEIIVLLLEFEASVLAMIRNNTNLVNDKNEISAKVLKKEHESFHYIKNLAQFYLTYISSNINNEDLIKLQEEGFFNFDNIEDAKKKINQYVSIRQGQPRFRKELLENYKQRCCMSGCDVQDTLEACHIYPYMGLETNHVQNGIILRADLHTLYDKGLLSIDENYKIRLSEVLKISQFYKFLDDKSIMLPTLEKNWPSVEAIRFKLKELEK